jgi:hypothetical protein
MLDSSELETTPTKSLHALLGDDDRDAAIDADRRALGRVVAVREVEVVGVAGASRAGHFDEQRERVTLLLVVEGIDDDVARLVGE